MILTRLAVGVALVVSTVACIDKGSNQDDLGSVNLSNVESGKQFKQSFMQPYLAQADSKYITAMEDTVSNDSSSTSAEFSGTNLQVKGVDESDMWKYDGENFFVLNPAQWRYQNNTTTSCLDGQSCDQKWISTPGSIRIVKNTKETLATIELGEQSGSDLFLNDDQLIMINKGQSYYGFMDIMIEPYYGRADSKARIRSWDVSDTSSPQDLHDVEVEGYIQRTRRMGDELYVVSRFTPRIKGLIAYPRTQTDIASNKAVLDSIDIKDLLPKIKINGNEEALVKATDCYVVNLPKDYRYGYAITTITRLNTKTNSFNSRCVSGPVDGIHMSEDNLYIYANSYYQFEVQDDDAVTWEWSQGNSHIHQFSLAAGVFDYKGSALLPGVSGADDANFRFGELEGGSLAVVTSTNQWQNPKHLLTVLKSNGTELKTVSQLPNELRPEPIGKPGERIYSVRFMQNRAYIVTFQNMDPLYAIDLSNIKDPRIAGELEIPGFSEYLHPIGSDLLIGIGQNAVTGATGSTLIQGVKIALFDVSDMNNPEELDVIDVGHRGSHTALSYDHHAFTGLQVDNQYRFAFPISVNDGAPSGSPSANPENQYHDWSYTGLHIFEVENKKLALQGALITDSSDDEKIYNHWNTRRGLIQGDEVYHLSGSDIYQANWATPSEVSEKF
jgi:uncharacterized secreted protein with C-terminal beta-propeller domain